ncbi:MAG: thiamine pyrophosphate-dependent enzyme [Patescibacteria group bacterium]|nr:thiamine pyrophosphate-dependent enzyme [Patescibacteria group bacterium]
MPTKTIIKPRKTSDKSLLASGHRACAGCGQAIAARTVINALGPNTIVANATGCLEVTTTPYPESSWEVPWIHSLFENPAAIASGILAALKQQSKDKSVKVLAQGGDGSTFDIGFGLISGMWERGENILYICYDNEAYSNTGMQASGATPWASSTTTTPAGTGPTIDAIGSHQRKKDMIAIAIAHGVKYAAQTTAGYLSDIEAKVKKAAAIDGPAYIQILSPCIPGWRIKSDQAMQIGKLAAQTGLYPILEYTDGKLSSKNNVPKPTPKVEEYLKLQGRFAHLFKNTASKKQLAYIQEIANNNIKKYELDK